MFPTYSKLEKHLLDAPLYGYRRNEESFLIKRVSLRTLSTRSHALRIANQIIYNAVFCFTPLWKHEHSAAIIAALRSCSGHLAAFNLIITSFSFCEAPPWFDCWTSATVLSFSSIGGQHVSQLPQLLYLRSAGSRIDCFVFLEFLALMLSVDFDRHYLEL
jgi:hypothetical protein